MRLHRLLPAFAAALAAMALTAPVRADILISIDKSTQQMTVMVDGATRYVWPVSTGVARYDTPSGVYKPFRMEVDHFSREWDDAPMPHSIFFTQKGHAIHGSYHKNIGMPASHGCVRLEPKNATILFALVKQEHMSNTRVVLTGETPTATGVAVARNNRRYQRSYDNDAGFTAALAPRQRWQQHWPRGHVYDGWPFYNRYNARLYPRTRRSGYETPRPFGRW